MAFGAVLGLLLASASPSVEESPDPAAEALLACAPESYQAALACLDTHLPMAAKSQLRQEGGASLAHFGLGMFIRNNWGLWDDAPLSRSMRGMGFQHPDDMSGVILRGYAARLRGQPFNLQERAAHYRRFWQAAEGQPDPLPCPVTETNTAGLSRQDIEVARLTCFAEPDALGDND